MRDDSGDPPARLEGPGRPPAAERDYFDFESLKDPADPAQMRQLEEARTVFYQVCSNADGYWVDPEGFDSTEWYDYFVEANAWHYLFHAPHDPAGLLELMGGREAFLARLEEMFRLSREYEDAIEFPLQYYPRPYYWHGNEKH